MKLLKLTIMMILVTTQFLAEIEVSRECNHQRKLDEYSMKCMHERFLVSVWPFLGFQTTQIIT